MGVVGSVSNVWRYPVKSMRGEELAEAFVGFAGVYGDRMFAFTSPSRPKGFPYVTGRERREMLLCQPRFRHPERAGAPPNLAEAEALAPGVTPTVADAEDLALDVDAGSGETFAVDDPALIERLQLGEDAALVRSERALTDCRPVSLISAQTAEQVGDELDMTLDAFAQTSSLTLPANRGSRRTPT